MKHLHYLAAIALGVTVLSSCSNDEVVSAPAEPNVIGFKAMANKTSRADAEVTTANIDRFRVFGCVTNQDGSGHIMNFGGADGKGTVVEKTDGKWSYNPVQYWTKEKNYFFVALSTNNAQPNWTFTAPTEHSTALDVNNFYGYGTVTMPIGTGNGERDLVMATASRYTDVNTNGDIVNTSAVNLTFKHLLSRVGITFTNNITSTNYSIAIANVKIGGLYAEGTLDLQENLAWAVTGEATATINGSISDATIVAKGGSVKTAEYRYILPVEQTLTITFDVNVYVNGTLYSTRTMTGTVPAQAYALGKSYMLNASITEENIVPGGAKPIEFTASVEAWPADENGGNVSF